MKARIPHERILEEAHRLDPVSLHNILMRTPDAEIAIPLLFMGEAEQRFLLSALSEEKAARIRSLMGRLQRVKIPYEVYGEVVKNLVIRLQGGRPPDVGTYYRPGSPRG
ncbi:hypothetical protein [Spirochaeta thermophila]|uniref:Flagellar motor switch protein FliG n=1 Tax=Winmispira thermophila (strain ATCC 49972 / DSM 6192 / RI 19.B1) TaxID=665571 RepID=E0RQX6_WINT6|nr:hypothetical protein [Spirochaeta thermophila]ADN03032.1 hypothetical protein STHERM_c21010 [Spirochaeta thermophila DSM 6192]